MLCASVLRAGLLCSGSGLLRSGSDLLRSSSGLLPRGSELLCPRAVLCSGTHLLLPPAHLLRNRLLLPAQEKMLLGQVVGLRKAEKQMDHEQNGLVSQSNRVIP